MTWFFPCYFLVLNTFLRSVLPQISLYHYLISLLCHLGLLIIKLLKIGYYIYIYIYTYHILPTF